MESIQFDPRGLVLALVLASIAGGVLLAAVLLALRNRPTVSAHLKHQLVLLSLSSLALLPLATPRHWAPAPEAPAAVDALSFVGAFAEKFADLSAPLASPSEAARSGWLWSALILTWGAGVVMLLLRLCWRLIGVARLRRRAVPVTNRAWISALDSARGELGLRRRVPLLADDRISSPMVWGCMRPFVVLPTAMLQEAPEESGARITFLHELAHLERRDSTSKLVAELVCAVFWFHPLAWITKRQLDLTQEMAADSQVIAAGVLPSVYSKHLLQLVRSPRPMASPLVGVSAASGEGPLSQRLLSILNVGQDHRAPAAMTSRLINLCFVLLLASLAGAQRFAQDTESVTESLHAALNPVFVRTMEDNHIAGAAISVVKDGQLIYHRGFGQAEVSEPRPVRSEQTVFRIGSVSKAVTGIAVMQCVDRGLLDLEADVNEYLKQFKLSDNYAEPVRVKHLLTHTAGFDQLGYGRHVGSREEVLPLGDFLDDNLVRVRLPGQVACYDTYAITLAGHLVEVVSGLGFEEYLKQNIFEPLGMDRSFITVPEELRSDVAVGYEYRGEYIPQRWEYMNTDPASTINSTVVDMSRLATMLLEGGKFGGVQILSAASARAMMTRQFTHHPEQPGFSYALFEDVEHGLSAFNHGGSMTGFGCFLYLVPEERLGVFVAYNQESGHMSGNAVPAVLRELLGDRFARPALRKRVDAVDVNRFVGHYTSNMYNHTRPERGGWLPRPSPLSAGTDGSIRFRGGTYFAVGESLFQREDGTLLNFLFDEDGEISHLVIQQTAFERM